MEWAVSVPGTVGGAIVNNAGAHDSDMAARVADVVVLDAERGAKLYRNKDLQFGYRTSVLKERADKRFLVLLATFIYPKLIPITFVKRCKNLPLIVNKPNRLVRV
jgi:UDP-N-acetylmuramate dehydrogenase